MQLTHQQRIAKQQEANELRAKLVSLREDLGSEAEYSDSLVDGLEDIVLIPSGVMQFVCPSKRHKKKEIITFKIPPSREGSLDDYVCICGIVYRRQI